MLLNLRRTALVINFTFAAFVICFATPAVHAREYGSQDASTAHLDESKVKGFARALDEVNQLHRKYELRLANTGPEESAAIRQKAAREISAAIESQGLTVDEYDSMARTMMTTSSLREQIEREMESF